MTSLTPHTSHGTVSSTGLETSSTPVGSTTVGGSTPALTLFTTLMSGTGKTDTASTTIYTGNTHLVGSQYQSLSIVSFRYQHNRCKHKLYIKS